MSNILRKNNLISLGTIMILAIVMIASCKKEGRHYAVSQEFKDFFLFQKGSYWIYKDDSTNAIDSTYLLGSPQYTLLQTIYQKKTDPTAEQYSLGFQSEIMLGYFIKVNTNNQNCLLIDISDSSNAFGMIDQLIPDSNYFFNTSFQGYFKVWPTIQSIEYNSIIYYNVIRTRFYNDEINCNFYFAKKIGLIKIFGNWGNKNHSWSLLRYHIIQ